MSMPIKAFLKPKGIARTPRKTKKQSDLEMAFLPNDLLGEDEIQIKLMNWAKRVKFGDNWLYDYMHHSPNGGLRTKSDAAKFKAMGVKAGYPDIVLEIARNGYHGLRVELKKKKGGTVSPEQKAWVERLNENGYLAKVCKGFDEAQQVITEYMSIGRNAKHDLECDVT